MALLIITLIDGCAQSPKEQAEERYQIESSYLEGNNESTIKDEKVGSDDVAETQSTYSRLQPLSSASRVSNNTNQLSQSFSSTEKANFAANNMPVVDFVHYAFGEVLGANYVVGNALKSDITTLTLNIQQPLSKRELFSLIADTLKHYQVNIDFDNNLFFIDKAELSKAKAIIGIGNTAASVPASAGQILQVIPLKYGIKISIERTIRQLIDATITPDFEQGAIFVLGDRANVLRAVELVNLLDTPANLGRNIGLLSLKYLPVADFIEKATELMKQEGLPIGAEQLSKGISLVPIDNIGSIAVFASSDELLNRVRYWANIMDQPARGESVRYFVYNPRYARASDMGISIGGLLGLGGQNLSTNQQSTGNNAAELAEESAPATQVVSGEDVSFVVDDRSNSIIFSTSANRYQALLPLLEQLDILPKQVLLEILIAEVQLIDNFQFGVEFALRNSSNVSVITEGSIGLGGGLVLNSLGSANDITASFFQDSSFVNTLSNPSLLVRDGVSANINIGTDIPVLAATITDGVNGQTQSIQYRQTGVSANVTPTVNAQGIVIMDIELDISNQLTTVVSPIPSPTIFQRSLSTEVVVQSGQTILLGGLISEDKTNAENAVPVLSNIPVLGNLFKGQDNDRTKTELVMLVTPKVIENNDQWEKTLRDFQSGLENIRIIE